MAAQHKSLTIKHFFVAFFSLSLLLSLGVFVYASQNKTNTESDASGQFRCGRDPQLTLDKDKTRGFETSVAYIITIKNVDNRKSSNKNCRPDTYLFNVDVPKGWKYDAESLEGRGRITLNENESDFISLRIIRPENAKKGVYDIKFGVYNLRHDDNNNDAAINLKYTVEKN
jgi:uncharacterized membrane protein